MQGTERSIAQPAMKSFVSFFAIYLTVLSVYIFFFFAICKNCFKRKCKEVTFPFLTLMKKLTKKKLQMGNLRKVCVKLKYFYYINAESFN